MKVEEQKNCRLENSMKRLAFLHFYIFTLCIALHAQSDPVIMTINGKNITRSEFEYSYNKNNSEGVIDKKNVNDYVPLFIDFKLKVAAAEDARFDTITSIQKELRGYKEQMVLPTIIDKDFIECQARETYDNTAARFEGEDLLSASHILVRMSPNATADEQAKAKVRIDSIYAALQAGADFAELARKCSEDPGSGQKGGALGQFGKGMMIPDFEKAAYALKKGEMSEPIKSTVGYHIIKMEDRHPFESYEFHHDNILKFLEQRGIKEASANALIDSVAKKEGVSRDVIIGRYYDDLISKDSDSKNLAQEYYDGTLMYEISKNQIWDVAAKDEEGLAKYFKANKKKYAFDEPRFRGLILHGKDDAVIATAKKLVKGVKEEDWPTTIVKGLNNDSVKVIRVEHGIYKKGDSKTVDNMVFNTGTEYKPMKDYPATDVFGKKLKKPETYKDVKGQVTTDYQQECEKTWVEGLRKKYPVDIDESVLATVNKH